MTAAGGTTATSTTLPDGVRAVRVPLAERSYDVLVGRGAIGEVAGLVPSSARQAVVVTQPGIDVDVDLGLPCTVVEIPHGERTKSLSTVEELCRRFAEAGLGRRDVVVAVGGGVVTDVAGFAAASWHRGTPVIHVATTLLGQVDAAIGGKTGVNLPEGKNLVGAFWQPLGVVCDPDVLESLPAAEWRSGYGEVAKYALLGRDEVRGLERLDLGDQIARCVECKANVVAADEREGGLRMILNYGHTLAHALEAAGLAGESGDLIDDGPPGRDSPDGTSGPGSPLRHGEAVAVGLAFAARLAHSLGRIGDDEVRRHDEVLAHFELPAFLPDGSDAAQLVGLMGRDKKAHGDLTFVLDGPGGVSPVHGVDPGIVTAVLEEFAREQR